MKARRQVFCQKAFDIAYFHLQPVQAYSKTITKRTKARKNLAF
jgi:hypothetical protein